MLFLHDEATYIFILTSLQSHNRAEYLVDIFPDGILCAALRFEGLHELPCLKCNLEGLEDADLLRRYLPHVLTDHVENGPVEVEGEVSFFLGGFPLGEDFLCEPLAVELWLVGRDDALFLKLFFNGCPFRLFTDGHFLWFLCLCWHLPPPSCRPSS